eukprot:maker-scaffold170_size291898-snap-gene-0.13 protein:Tk03002 transcript:maker-scaffold170_size291898-snap-gene-0.13-mRNA-1 annotation:"pq-loop repeat-containing protein 1"
MPTQASLSSAVSLVLGLLLTFSFSLVCSLKASGIPPTITNASVNDPSAAKPRPPNALGHINGSLGLNMSAGGADPNLNQIPHSDTSAAMAPNTLMGNFSGIFLTIVSYVSQGAMVVGGVVPYIPQFMAIRENKSAKGFSLYVCLALLVANTLRILFWFGKHYEYPLLIQSILMNAAMFALIHLCVNIRRKEQIVKTDEHVFTDFEVQHFWQWTDFQSYVECIMTLAVSGGILMYFLVDVEPFVESVGFLAVFTEACLGVPQFYRNARTKSTFGMSVQMVLMWTCGDIFKTTYFYLRETPPQFIICGSLQVLIDLSILSQVWIYRENTARRKKSEIHLSS